MKRMLLRNVRVVVLILLPFGIVGGLAVGGEAARPQPLVTESPISGISDGTSVSISTSAYTLVPAAGNMISQSGLIVNNLSTNTAVMRGILSTSSTTAPTGSGALEFSPSADFSIVPVAQDVYLWMKSLATGAETVAVQPFQ